MANWACAHQTSQRFFNHVDLLAELYKRKIIMKGENKGVEALRLSVRQRRKETESRERQNNMSVAFFVASYETTSTIMEDK
ncbi:hypothetical protein WN944_005870 [Citrus x changshan-huyou]|uniref:Uncharacterized protein n=1 Tax=Citrus x changshan-huyou TaxID=2935761 RepID=A0AAP0QSZ1_9ROSI